MRSKTRAKNICIFNGLGDGKMKVFGGLKLIKSISVVAKRGFRDLAKCLKNDCQLTPKGIQND